MAKKKEGWKQGEGPYSSSKGLGITQYRGNLAETDDFSDSVDRSATVDENAGINGGNAGVLRSPKR